MYKIAGKNMQSRQCKSVTYDDRKIQDNKYSQTADLVFIFLHRNLKQKLTYNWEGPHKITKVSHPAYQIELKTVSETSYKWVTRDKLKILPQDLNVLKPILLPRKDKPKSGVLVYDDTSDDSGEDEQVNVNGSGHSVSNLRQRIDPPRRMVTL